MLQQKLLVYRHGGPNTLHSRLNAASWSNDLFSSSLPHFRLFTAFILELYSFPSVIITCLCLFYGTSRCFLAYSLSCSGNSVTGSDDQFEHFDGSALVFWSSCRPLTHDFRGHVLTLCYSLWGLAWMIRNAGRWICGVVRVPSFLGFLDALQH